MNHEEIDRRGVAVNETGEARVASSSLDPQYASVPSRTKIVLVKLINVVADRS